MRLSPIPLSLFIYLVITLLGPALRHRLQRGQWPTTFHRSPEPVQRLLGLLLGGLILAGLVWTILLVAIPPGRLAIWTWPSWSLSLGWVLLVAGSALELAGQQMMGGSFRIGIDDRPTELVTAGLFRWTRNPIFSGLLVALLGVVLLTPSPWTVATYFWIVSLIAIQVRLEEAHLLRLHGEAYAAYQGRVGRFWPRFLAG